MGIIAFCPAGHRMKVKDYLAGRKGICPTCGARFRIPLASTVPPPHTPPRPGTGEAAVGVAPVATIVSLDPAAAAGLPELLMIVDPVELGVVDAPLPTAPLIDPDPTADLRTADDEDDDDEDDATEVLYWYHAIPGGQPSAALREPEMVAWLDAGQATGREVVWRSDWPGWKPIGEAFPERFPPSFPGPGRW
ncbi:MAG: hypothetical protein ACKO40_09260 [Planctomycetaceae bacterium]